MSFITPNLPPKTYSDPLAFEWVISDDVLSLTGVVNGVPPAISSYIAYDELEPPNPFIATTQDGKGNVVYDGGFPKFYNSRLSNNTGDDFDGLYASLKFLYNALNFIHNPTKEKRVLGINDKRNGESYSIKGTNSNGFYNTVKYVSELADFQVDFIDLDDFPDGILDIRLSQLNQYSCLLVFGTGNGEITESSINDIVTFREQGGGLFLVTDHGPVIERFEDAVSEAGGFFPLVNKIAVNFGAYFSGDYDRSPVNVGFLRETYGNHPLYNGLSDDDSILAGGSESKVVVTEVETFDPSNLPTITVDEDGLNIISFLAIMNDGRVETTRYGYNLGNEFLRVTNQKGNVSKTDYRYHTYFPSLTEVLTVESTDPTLGTLTGVVERQGVQVGTFTVDGSTTIEWDEAQLIDGFKNEDEFVFIVASPFHYTTTIMLNVETLPTNIDALAPTVITLQRVDYPLPGLADVIISHQKLVSKLKTPIELVSVSETLRDVHERSIG